MLTFQTYKIDLYSITSRIKLNRAALRAPNIYKQRFWRFRESSRSDSNAGAAPHLDLSIKYPGLLEMILEDNSDVLNSSGWNFI